MCPISKNNKVNVCTNIIEEWYLHEQKRPPRPLGANLGNTF